MSLWKAYLATKLYSTTLSKHGWNKIKYQYNYCVSVNVNGIKYKPQTQTNERYIFAITLVHYDPV